MINKLLAKNSVVWVIAVMMAALIWLAAFVDEQSKIYVQDTRVFYKRPIVVSSFPGALYIENLGPENVVGYLESITLTGSSALIANTADRDVRAYVDLQGLEEGQHTVVPWIEKPTNLQETGRDPQTIQVVLQAKITKDLPVEIIRTGEMAPGASVISESSIPSVVTISGPRSSVAAAVRVVVEVPVTPATVDVNQDLPLVLLNAMGDPIQDYRIEIVPSQVHVRQNIEAVKELPLLPGRILIPDEVRFVGATLTPAHIRVAGAADLLSELSDITLEDLDLRDVDPELLSEWGLREDDLFWKVLLRDPTLTIEKGQNFSQMLRLPLTLLEDLRFAEAETVSHVELRVELEWIAESLSGESSVVDEVYGAENQVYGSVYLPVSGSVYSATYGVSEPVYGTVYR